MMEIFEARSKLVSRLTRCPACGQSRLDFIIGELGSRAFFHCGSVFTCKGGEPITAEAGCPTSAAIAAIQLNREAAAMVSSKKVAAE